jgi:hypothetical protein
MKKRLVFLLIFHCCFALENAWPKVKTETIDYMGGDMDTQCVGTFDAAKYSKKELENAYYLLTELIETPLKWLKLCYDKPGPEDPKYIQCGKRDFGDTNFFYNSKVSIEWNEKLIEKAEKLKIPKELDQAKSLILQELKYDQWIQKTLLNYLEKRDAKILSEARFEGTAFKECAKDLGDIDKIKEPQAVSKKVLYEMHNCILKLRPFSAKSKIKNKWADFIINEKCEESDESRD